MHNNYYLAKETSAMPISADLGQQLENVVENLVKNGRYNSKSEVLREGVRLVQEREARLAALDAAISRGIADSDADRVKPAEEVFARLEEKYRAKVSEFDEKRERWLRSEVTARDAEMRNDPSIGVPTEEAFNKILKISSRNR
jgi:antitoxin ParD1/3/4